MMGFHQGLLMSVSAAITQPPANAIDGWFTGGGLGVYYHVHPYYCFTDTAGTINAAIGDPVARINDSGPGHFYLTNPTTSQQPKLQYDATLGRYYLDFSSAFSQRLGSQDSSATSDWKWLNDGTEWQAVALVQYGNSSNPNALYFLWGTQAGSASQVGASMFYDDRSTASFNNAQRQQVTRGSAPAPIDYNVQNAITPDAPHVVSQSYAYAVSGNDLILRNDGSVTGGAESAIAPNNTNPQGRLTLAASVSGTFTLDGRIYSLAILRGSGCRTNVTTYEGVI